MSRSVVTSTHVMTKTAFPVPAVGACAVWFRPSWAYNGGTSHVVLLSGDGTNNFQLFKFSDSNFYCGWYVGGSYRIQPLADQIVQNAWNLLLIQWDASWTTDKTRLWLNNQFYSSGIGALVTYDVSALPLTVGNYADTYPMNGLIGPVAFWNATFPALTSIGDSILDPQWIALRNGVPFNRMHPESLLAYWPMWGDDSPEPDWTRDGRSLTLTGTTKGASNPPIGLPRIFRPDYSEQIYPFGTVCWGHDTGVTESNIRNLSGNWTGSGYISGVGDAERINFVAAENEESETWNIGAHRIKIQYNKYASGSGVPTIKYKNGSSQALCEADTWHTYTVPFVCTGWVKVRIET